MAVTSAGFELRGERSSLRRLARDLWASRELVATLARKDFFVRYRRASFGLLWAIGLPLAQAAVLAAVLSRLVRFPTPVSYAVFVYSGMLPWAFFSGVLNGAVGAIIEGQAVATRIYFPRAVLPLVVVGANLYGFVPGVFVLLIMAASFGVDLGVHVLYLIPATALMVLLASAFGLVLAVLEVYFRDMRHILTAVTLPWFWGSAIFYPLSQFSGIRAILEANPATGMIQLFRVGLGAADAGWPAAVAWTIGWTAVMWGVAALLYRRYDRVCVDLM